MNETYFAELFKYLIPNISIEDLQKEPYDLFAKEYCEMSLGFNFFQGYVQPTITQRAKIYRSINLCSKNKEYNNFISITSTYGVIIKYRGEPPTDKFDKYIDQSDNYVFIPKECNSLDIYDYTYYRRMLSDFCLKENISCEIICNIESDKWFLFLSLNEPLKDLEIKWDQYDSGGIYKTFDVSPEELPSCFLVFPWEQRVEFKIKEGKIQMTVKTISKHDFDTRIKQLRKSKEKPWNYIDLPNIIDDECEAFGIARILLSCGTVLPLVGTNRVYINDWDENLEERVKRSIQDFDISDIPTDGIEIFTQESYKDMSLYRKASLYKINIWYSLVHLCQGRPQDPHTRKMFSPFLVNELKSEIKKIKGPFLKGFPVIKYDPQLVTEKTSGNVSFYVCFDKIDPVFIWQIPNLQDTEYFHITNEAIQILTAKWSDKSIFENIMKNKDIYLIFVPKALYLFETSSVDIASGLYPKDKHSQAKYLQNHINILRTI